MSKRANGEGSIYRDKAKGKWVASLSIDGRRIKREAATQKEARLLLEELRKQSVRSAPKNSNLRTVADLLGDWLDSRMASDERAASTLVTSRWAISHLNRHLGAVRLSKLTFEDVERALKAMASKEHLARPSLIKIRSVLNQACKWGERRGALATNPVGIAELPKTKTTPSKRSLTHQEVQNLLAAIAGSRLEALWTILLGLGLRSGEVRALLWKDWDRRNGTLAVRRNVGKINGVLTVVDHMKTPASKRTLALPSSITALLEAHFELSKRQAQAAPDDLIFSTSSGRPLDSANLRRDLKRLCEQAGIPEVCVHELRHTCASLLADAGVPAESLADVLGHRDIRTTHGTYRHAISPSVSSHVGPMNSILS